MAVSCTRTAQKEGGNAVHPQLTASEKESEGRKGKKRCRNLLTKARQYVSFSLELHEFFHMEIIFRNDLLGHPGPANDRFPMTVMGAII